MKKHPVLLHVSTRRVRLAVGRAVSGGFLVYAGSHAAADVTPSTPDSVAKLRDALATARVLVPVSDGSGELAFAQDFAFASSSAAASVVTGMSANGLDAWKPMI